MPDGGLAAVWEWDWLDKAPESILMRWLPDGSLSP